MYAHFMHIFMHRCTVGAVSSEIWHRRCGVNFLVFWHRTDVSEMATPHRTAGHPNFDFQDVFFEIKTNILFKHDSNDFVINTQNKKFSFDKIYNLSQFKLKMLKTYIIKQLNKKFIGFFKSFANALVLFVSKKMKIFICALIIKN